MKRRVYTVKHINLKNKIEVAKNLSTLLQQNIPLKLSKYKEAQLHKAQSLLKAGKRSQATSEYMKFIGVTKSGQLRRGSKARKLRGTAMIQTYSYINVPKVERYTIDSLQEFNKSVESYSTSEIKNILNEYNVLNYLDQFLSMSDTGWTFRVRRRLGIGDDVPNKKFMGWLLKFIYKH